MSLNKFVFSERFHLEDGGTLNGFELGYHTYGKLNKDAKVVWVFHALTANSDPFDWWKGLFGGDSLFNEREYFIVCCNVLGSCYGSSNPTTGDVLGDHQLDAFPLITVRDNIRAFQLLKNHLGIGEVYLSIGGSFGGFQALEFCKMLKCSEHLITIAATSIESSFNVAVHEAQRLCIEASGFSNAGLTAARAMGMTSYRTREEMELKQARENDQIKDFRSSSYVRYQGSKLKDRFDSHAYYSLLNTLDAHDLSRGYESLEEAVGDIESRSLFVGIHEDRLSHAPQIEEESKYLKNGNYHEIHSKYGHDGFLIETEQLTEIIRNFLNRKR